MSAQEGASGDDGDNQRGTIATSPAYLHPDSEEGGGRSGAWFNASWLICAKNGSLHDIKTRVDSQSFYSMIHSSAVKALGLTKRPLLKPEYLRGIFGGEEAVVEYVETTAQCPAIGLNATKLEVFVVKADELKGQLLIGTKFAEDHQVFEKIVEAKKRHGPLPPGQGRDSLVDVDDAIIKVILDRRSKAAKKKDDEKHNLAAVERAPVIDEILRAKSVGTSMSTGDSMGSAMSVFSGVHSIASTVATSASSSSAATGKSGKGIESANTVDSVRSEVS